MRFVLLFAIQATWICLSIAPPAAADILIDFENTPSGVFNSYTEQGVTFTALNSGNMTSELFGNAPNGTRGLIGVPDNSGGEGGSGGGGGSLTEQTAAGPSFPQLPQTTTTTTPTFPSFPTFPALPSLEFPPFPTYPTPPGEGPVPPGFFSAIRADFDFVANFVCVDLGDNWPDEEKLFLRAFGENGNLIGEVFVNPGGVPGVMKTLAITAPGIHYVMFGSMEPSQDGSSVFADNFCAGITGDVNPVPEPAGATALLILAGAALAAKVGKRRLKVEPIAA